LEEQRVSSLLMIISRITSKKVAYGHGVNVVAKLVAGK